MSSEENDEPTVKLRCDVCGTIEQRIAYSALPLRLNGCTDDALPEGDPRRQMHHVRIEEYQWP